MSNALSIARIKRHGQVFEINVDADKALQFKNSDISDISEVLLFEQVFTDIKKGLKATGETLAKAFQTTDSLKVAQIIVKEGEIQLSSEHRAKEREQKTRQLVTMIHTNTCDPKTGFPHPITRIEAALEEAKIHFDDHKSVQGQFDEIVKKLRPIIPISIEQKTMHVTIPPLYVSRVYQNVKNNSNILKEEWNSDGSWKIKVEIPAGVVQQYIEMLNKYTHGDIIIENE